MSVAQMLGGWLMTCFVCLFINFIDLLIWVFTSSSTKWIFFYKCMWRSKVVVTISLEAFI